MNDINNALGLASPYTQTVSLNDSSVRTILGRSSGTISLSDAYGKPVPPSKVSFSIPTSTKNINLRTWAVNAGWDQSVAVEFTIDTGVYVWSDSISTPAIETGGSFPGGLSIINKGYIMGKGGNGGWNQTYPPESGGTAINLSCSVTIDNRLGYIGGGGGGGTGGVAYSSFAGGGGAGGGNGGGFIGFSGSSYGLGGAIGASGTTGGPNSITGNYQGGGGGRIMPGTGGAGGYLSSGSYAPYGGGNTYNPGAGGGAGGGGSAYLWTGNSGGGTAIGGAGGSGGSAGTNGTGTNTTGSTATYATGGGGGGGWGASGGSSRPGSGQYSSPGSGGKAVALNTNYSVTWTGGYDSTRTFGGVS